MQRTAALLTTLFSLTAMACTSIPGTAAVRPEVQRLLDVADSARRTSETSVTELVAGSDAQALIKAATTAPVAPPPASAPSGQTVTWRQAVDNGNGTVTVSVGSIGREFPTYRDSSIVVTVDKEQPQRILQFKTARSVSQDYPAGEVAVHERIGTVDGGYRETLHLDRREYNNATQAASAFAVEMLATSPNGRAAERQAYLLTLPGGEKVSLTRP